MILGRVCGAIHSTVNHPFYEGKRLLMVAYLAPDGTPTEKYVIAVDAVDAGAGETVLIVDEGNSARQIVDVSNAPIRSIVVGIVDEVALASSPRP